MARDWTHNLSHRVHPNLQLVDTQKRVGLNHIFFSECNIWLRLSYRKSVVPPIHIFCYCSVPQVWKFLLLIIRVNKKTLKIKIKFKVSLIKKKMNKTLATWNSLLCICLAWTVRVSNYEIHPFDWILSFSLKLSFIKCQGSSCFHCKLLERVTESTCPRVSGSSTQRLGKKKKILLKVIYHEILDFTSFHPYLCISNTKQVWHWWHYLVQVCISLGFDCIVYW